MSVAVRVQRGAERGLPVVTIAHVERNHTTSGPAIRTQ